MKDLALLVFFAVMFLKSKNAIVTLMLAFVMLFYIEVCLVEFFFKASYSPLAQNFDTLNVVQNTVTMFVCIVSFVNYKVKTDLQYLGKLWHFKLMDLAPFLLICSFAIYVIYTKSSGTLDGKYADAIVNRAPIFDYVFILVVLAVFLSKGRFLVLLATSLLAVGFLLAGERLRGFAYALVLYGFVFNDFSSVRFKVLLVLGVGLGVFISIIRSNFGSMDGVHASTFGGVTISSMYLLEYVDEMNLNARLGYLLGILFGNFVPASYLPEGLDIRSALFGYANIPGGGWFPVWFHALGGYSGAFLISVVTAYLVKFVSLGVEGLMRRGSSVNRLFFIMFLAQLPKWFLYTPYQFLKISLYAVLLLVLCQFASSVLKRCS